MMFDKEMALNYIQEQKNVFISVSDDLWGYGELAFKEYQSSKRLIEVLESEGFKIESGLAGIPTAFRASYGKGRPVIGILGEFDALEGLSQEGGVAVRRPLTEGGSGHGCGHNCLGSGALAGAIGAKKYLENHPKIPGTVIYFGCPGEEGKSGKAFMAREEFEKRLNGEKYQSPLHPDEMPKL